PSWRWLRASRPARGRRVECRTRYGPGDLRVPVAIVGLHLRRRVNGVQVVSPQYARLYSGDGGPRSGSVVSAGPGGSVMTAEVAQAVGPRTLEDPLAEALRIVAAANARGLLLRRMGGMGVRADGPDWTHRNRRREVDLDV